MELLLLICVYLPVLLIAQGNAKITPLIVFKREQRNITVYKFELNNTIVDSAWQMVNGINRGNGEFTYVNVQTEPNLSDRIFGTKWLICQLTYLTGDLDVIVTDAITTDKKCKKMRMRGKPDGSDAILFDAEEKGAFFVPRVSLGPETLKVLVDMCYSNGVIFTSLRNRPLPCQPGSVRVGGEAMTLNRYKGIACKPPPANNSHTKYSPSNFVDMVYPSTLHVTCAPGYNVTGGYSYRCAHGVWNRPFQNCTEISSAQPKTNWKTIWIIIAVAIVISVLATALCTAIIVHRLTKKSQIQHIQNHDYSEPCSPCAAEAVIYEEINDANINMYEQLQHNKNQGPRRLPDRNEKNDYQSLESFKRLPSTP